MGDAADKDAGVELEEERELDVPESPATPANDSADAHGASANPAIATIHVDRPPHVSSSSRRKRSIPRFRRLRTVAREDFFNTVRI